jgi:hypothetical protein
MVSSIVIENEQIGPTRYIARLGILFDRARAGQLLGTGSAAGRRSAPFLVIPVLQTGAFHQSFETRNEWLRAWNRFRTGGSAIDYVRTSGSGPDPLLLNVGQTRRPGRGWWRMLLDNYGAADVSVPELHLKRTYPGGPAYGTFTARYSPDNRVLGRFTLRAGSSEAIPRMLGRRRAPARPRLHAALEAGLLTPDPTLVVVEPALLSEWPKRSSACLSALLRRRGRRASRGRRCPRSRSDRRRGHHPVDTPVAAAIGQAELAVSRVPGVHLGADRQPCRRRRFDHARHFLRRSRRARRRAAGAGLVGQRRGRVHAHLAPGARRPAARARAGRRRESGVGVNQIALPLDWPVADGDDDFLISDANRTAFDHLKRWSVWPVPITLLTGPPSRAAACLAASSSARPAGRLFDNAQRHDEELLFHAWNDARSAAVRCSSSPISRRPAGTSRCPICARASPPRPQIQIEDPDEPCSPSSIAKLLGDRGSSSRRT